MNVEVQNSTCWGLNPPERLLMLMLMLLMLILMLMLMPPPQALHQAIKTSGNYHLTHLQPAFPNSLEEYVQR